MTPPRPPRRAGRFSGGSVERGDYRSYHRRFADRGGEPPGPRRSCLAEIQPFAGIRYRAADLSRVLAPPYDVIPPAHTRRALRPRPRQRRARHPEPDAGGRRLRRGRGDVPALAGRGRRCRPTRRRRSTCSSRASPPAGGRCGGSACWPASGPRTRSGGSSCPTSTRARRRRRTAGACSSPRRPTSARSSSCSRTPAAAFAALVLEAIGHRPAAQYTDDGGVGHRMWRVEEPDLVGRLQALLGGVKSYIADGHHRHATALRYRDAVGPDGAWTLGYFTPIEAPGLARAALPPDPLRGAVARGGGEAPRPALPADRPAGRSAAASSAVAASPAPYAFALAEPGERRARRGGRDRGRGAAPARGAGLPARARHVLPAPRGARTAPRRARRGGELRPLAGRSGGGPGQAAPAASPS